MKKLAFLAFACLFAVFFTFSAAADTETPEEYKDFVDKIPENLSGDVADRINGDDILKDAENLVSWDFFLSAFGKDLKEQFQKVLPFFITLSGLVIISAAFGAIKSSISQKTSEFLSFCLTSVIAASTVGVQIGVVSAVSNWINDITTLTNAMLPVTLSLYIGGGNLKSAAVGNMGMSVFTSFSQNLLGKTVLPFSWFLISLTIISSVTGGIELSGFINSIKKTYVTVLTFIMAIFCAILAAQSAIAGGSDSISLRAVKFVAGSAIPIVGGSVGESMKTLSSGITLMRKAFGGGGIVMVLLMTLPILLLLLLTKASFGFSAATAELLGCKKESKMLSDFGGIYGCLAAVVAACSVMFIFMLLLLLSSATAF